MVLLGVKIKNFPVVFKCAVKNKEKLRKNGKFLRKSNLVFGVTPKVMTIDK